MSEKIQDFDIQKANELLEKYKLVQRKQEEKFLKDLISFYKRSRTIFNTKIAFETKRGNYLLNSIFLVVQDLGYELIYGMKYKSLDSIKNDCFIIVIKK